MIKPNERLTRRPLLHELRQGAVLVRSFDVEHGTTWSLASGRGVAASKALAVLQDAQARWCGDCLWGEWPEDLAQTYAADHSASSGTHRCPQLQHKETPPAAPAQAAPTPACEIRRAIEIEANTLSAPPKPDGGEAAACVHKAREKIKRCLPGLVDMLLSVANGPNTPATIFLRLKATGYLLAIAGISSETEEQAARDA